MTRAGAMYYTGIIGLVTSLICCTAQLMLPLLSKLFTEFKILIFGVFLPLVIGSYMFIPFGGKLKVAYPPENVTNDWQSDVEIVGCPVSQKWCLTDPAITVAQYVVSQILCAWAMVLGMTLVQILLSKSIGKRPPGVYMGYLTSVGSSARIIAPICVTAFYSEYGLTKTFTVIGTIFLLVLIWLWMIRFVTKC